MKITLAVSFVSAAIFVLVGCNNSPSPVPTGSVASPSTNPNSGGVDAKEGVPAATTDSPTSGTNASQSVQQSPTKDATTPQHELIAGIQNPDIVRRFESTRKRAEENPADWQAQLQYINLLQEIGQERVQLNEPDKAYPIFGKSAALAHKLLETKTEIPESAHNTLAVAFYNEACVYARNDKSDAAIDSLEEAFKWGFSDFDLLEKDKDLASVRKAVNFIEKVERWKQVNREKALKKTKE